MHTIILSCSGLLLDVDAHDVNTLAIRMQYIYTHARYYYRWAGPIYNSWLLTSLLRVSQLLATLLDSMQELILAL